MNAIRTLVRADKLTQTLVVPAWAHDISLPLAGRTDVPENVLDLINGEQVYFHAHVNIGAELPSQIEFDNWDTSVKIRAVHNK